MIKYWSEGIEHVATAEKHIVRRFRWLPKWLPFCSKADWVITTEATPQMGSYVVFTYTSQA